MQPCTEFPGFGRIQYIQSPLQVKIFINIYIMNRDQLVEELKQQIIEQLNLQVKPSDIVAADPLFNEGLGLDSIDALELIVLMQQKYRIKLANAEDGPKVFQSVDTMADFIIANQTPQAG